MSDSEFFLSPCRMSLSQNVVPQHQPLCLGIQNCSSIWGWIFLFKTENPTSVSSKPKLKELWHTADLFADLGSNNSGYYDLQAVLTHQGRSSSSGHYVGWVKRKEGNHWIFILRHLRHICVIHLYQSQILSVHRCSGTHRFLFCLWSLGLIDEWVKFDDDKVSLVSPEDILRLSGGGDWHIAYVLLYGPRRLEILEEEQ